MPYEGFRVKSIVKSFRDLEVYQKTIQLANELSNLSFVGQELISMSASIPRLIAESYGDKFDSRELAHNKLTEALRLLAGIIAGIDLLREKYSEAKDQKELLDSILTKYQTQKTKILNLRKAWDRVFTNAEK